MEKFDKVMLWVKQITLDMNVTVNNAIDFIFTPLYAFIDFLQNTVHQWATKPEETENNNEEKHIGFKR